MAPVMVNEDVATLTSGIRSLSERVGYKYAEVARQHRFRFLFDSLRLLEQGDFIRRYRAGENPGPPSIELDPSNACNHDCSFCIYHSMHALERSERLPVEVMFGVIDDIAEMGCRSILFVGGGEPMAHPRTVDAIERAAGHGMSVGLVTNGSLVKPHLASRLKQAATYVRFSLDAADPRLHHTLHGRDDHPKIIANLQALTAAEGPCTVGTGFFVNEMNVDDLVRCGELVKASGGDYIQYKSYSGMAVGEDLYETMLLELEKALELADGSFDVHIVDRLFENSQHQVRGYSKCHWQALKPIVGADGSVYLCAQKRTNPNGIIGNVLEQSFREIWEGARRQQVVENLDLVSCPYCVHHRQNQMLEFMTNYDAPHGSFF